MESVLSRNGKPLFVVDGYMFGFHKNLQKGITRWICCKRTCQSFIKLNSSNELVEAPLEHNHDKNNTNSINRQNSVNNLKRKDNATFPDSYSKLQCVELHNSDDSSTNLDATHIRRISSYPAIPILQTNMDENILVSPTPSPQSAKPMMMGMSPLYVNPIEENNHMSAAIDCIRGRALTLQSPALHGSMEENFLESSPSSPPASSSRATPCRAAPHHLGYRVREKGPHPWMAVRKGVEKVARDIKYIHIQDVNALVRRLRVLNTSVEGDPTAHAREVTIIVKALREAGVIE